MFIILCLTSHKLSLDFFYENITKTKLISKSVWHLMHLEASSASPTASPHKSIDTLNMLISNVQGEVQGLANLLLCKIS